MGSKTRFVVDMAGELVEFFSVQERADGSLIVFPHRACQYTDPALGLIKEEHLSVHLSPNSPGTTIKRTCALQNGRVMTYSSFVSDSKAALLWPLYSATTPRFAKGNLRKRAKDRIVTITRFNHRSATLVYSIFVSSRGFDHSPAFSAVNLVTAAFARFEIGVFYSFMPLPSLPSEDIQVPGTSPRQVDGVVADRGTPQGQRSFELTELEPFVTRTFVSLGELMHFRLLQFRIELTPDILNMFRVGTQTFLKYPPPFEEDTARAVIVS